MGKYTMNQENSHNILVVDDDATFRRGLHRLFSIIEGSGRFELVDAANGTEAEQAVKQGGVDCVLLDQNMPGGTGLQWLSRLLEANKDTAVIMVTGAGNEEIAVKAMQAGAMDYLVKGSITQENMLRAILNALKKIEMRKTIDEQNEQLLDAERHRVMVESLGAACHHLGQPATVISAYLEMLKQAETDTDKLEMLKNCLEAVRSMDEVLRKLNQIATYRSEPYVNCDSESDEDETRILSL